MAVLASKARQSRPATANPRTATPIISQAQQAVAHNCACSSAAAPASGARRKHSSDAHSTARPSAADAVAAAPSAMTDASEATEEGGAEAAEVTLCWEEEDVKTVDGKGTGACEAAWLLPLLARQFRLSARLLCSRKLSRTSPSCEKRGRRATDTSQGTNASQRQTIQRGHQDSFGALILVASVTHRFPINAAIQLCKHWTGRWWHLSTLLKVHSVGHKKESPPHRVAHKLKEQPVAVVDGHAPVAPIALGVGQPVGLVVLHTAQLAAAAAERDVRHATVVHVLRPGHDI